METFSSKLLQAAVEEFSRLPGIGKKTALRLVLHLLKQETEAVVRFSGTMERLRREVIYCKQCFNISDDELCEICRSPRRDSSLICVVEDLRDVIAIENTGQYQGLYHVLGGIISPVEGIGPGDLNISTLLERISSKKEIIREIIFALSTTMEGDTTNFYLYRKIKPFDVKVSVIARGIAIGNEIEYADEVTLGRSIVNRTLYENLVNK
ncbi:MAG TPA: recombination mediator RecR [Bacteroidales bacterium]|nr:recombination mediator RecR [Bacteroidales bacterium]